MYCAGVFRIDPEACTERCHGVFHISVEIEESPSAQLLPGVVGVRLGTRTEQLLGFLQAHAVRARQLVNA